jgi:hypothetical protein
MKALGKFFSFGCANRPDAGLDALLSPNESAAYSTAER